MPTCDSTAVELVLYPADTLTQARAFYARPQTVSGLRELRERPGWSAGPNFHFGHMQRGYCWTANESDLDQYVELWTERLSNGAGAVPASDWNTYWAWLGSEKIAAPADRPDLDRNFTHTNRQLASPRPGIWVARRWGMDEAVALDVPGPCNSGGKLAGAVREELNAALVAFGEPPLAVSAAATRSSV